MDTITQCSTEWREDSGQDLGQHNQVPLYVTKAMKSQEEQFSGTHEILGQQESPEKKMERGYSGKGF